MDIENKLEEFRKQAIQKELEKEKQKAEQNKKTVNYSQILSSYFQKFWNYGIKDENSPSHSNEKTENQTLRKRKIVNKKQNLIKKDEKENEDEEEEEETEEEETNEEQEIEISKLTIVQIVLRFILWLSLFLIFIKLEFGAVYFVISLLIIIYLNTNVGKRHKKLLSAYSVFNPNVERIQGTITPEQLQRNMVGLN